MAVYHADAADELAQGHPCCSLQIAEVKNEHHGIGEPASPEGKVVKRQASWNEDHKVDELRHKTSARHTSGGPLERHR